AQGTAVFPKTMSLLRSFTHRRQSRIKTSRFIKRRRLINHVEFLTVNSGCPFAQSADEPLPLEILVHVRKVRRGIIAKPSPILGRSDAHDLAEHRSKVTLIAEADILTDVLHRFFRVR